MTTFVPSDEAQLSCCVRDAAGRGSPLAVRGGGTRSLSADGRGDVLSTSGLTGISLYEPEALTIIALAGTPLAQVEAVLAAEGQQLPFEPWDARALTGITDGVPTIGGAAATNASGPRRLQAGACRDSMIGIRFVDGSGTVIRNGGRVMKNVTGLDLVKLLAGSRGTLGVITQVAFKVLPEPETTGTVVFEGLDVLTGVAAMTSAMSTPFDVTGAAYVPGEASRTLLRVEGFADSVKYRTGELASALSEFGAARFETGGDIWRDIRDARLLDGSEGAVWRISVRPTDGPLVAARLPGARLLLDWSGGLVWAKVGADFDLRAAVSGIPGQATLVSGPSATHARFGAVHPEPPALAAISAGLRRKFDPKGILNRGLMGAPAPEPV